MKAPQHTPMAAGRWQTFTLAEQLGNIGSEYGRARHARARGEATRFHHATDRLLALFDLTLADPRWRGRRLRELARVREAVCEEFFGQHQLGQSFEKYFLHFATASRADR